MAAFHGTEMMSAGRRRLECHHEGCHQMRVGFPELILMVTSRAHRVHNLTVRENHQRRPGVVKVRMGREKGACRPYGTGVCGAADTHAPAESRLAATAGNRYQLRLAFEGVLEDLRKARLPFWNPPG